jgi:hypothetical protein
VRTLQRVLEGVGAARPKGARCAAAQWVCLGVRGRTRDLRRLFCYLDDGLFTSLPAVPTTRPTGVATPMCAATDRRQVCALGAIYDNGPSLFCPRGVERERVSTRTVHRCRCRLCAVGLFCWLLVLAVVCLLYPVCLCLCLWLALYIFPLFLFYILL